jgi:regulator of protease activity HflC (stomatin/prohibitin superfamily)
MNTEVYIGVVLVVSGVGAVITSRRPDFNVPEGFYGLLYWRGKSLHRISPGRHRFWRRGYSMRLVDMRRTTLSITGQEVSSADHTGVKLSTVLTYQIIQAETAMHEVQDHVAHLQVAAQLAVRSVLGVTPLEELLNQHWDIGRQLLAHVQPAADRIGIIVHSVEVTEVALPEPTESAASLASKTHSATNGTRQENG